MKVFFYLFIILFSNNIIAQVFGCTDPLAVNFDKKATNNDGSCIYEKSTIEPIVSFLLSDTIIETSGLIFWNDMLWTHNDDTDINIYALDTINGKIIDSIKLKGTINTDWEEISQDEKYIYIGDFGNNANGNRNNLNILRIEKQSFLLKNPKIDTIKFSYSNQEEVSSSKGRNNTDFDCEAFIVKDDSLFLFTKQWVSNKTSVYSLPKIPGEFIAKYKYTFDVKVLITGATYIENKNIIALCGYNKFFKTFIYLLYDFNDNDFFGGNVRKLDLSLNFHQIEAITSVDGLKYYLTNEYFFKSPLPPFNHKYHIFDLSIYLEQYLSKN